MSRPWEIGAPQPALLALLARVPAGKRVLDAGCGIGELAVVLAARGHDVTGVDVSAAAIEAGRAKAAAAGVDVRFEVRDATRLPYPDGSFDTVCDSGLLHTLHRYGGAVADYLATVTRLTRPGGTACVLAVSAADGHGWGVTEAFLRDCFPPPAWRVGGVDEVDVRARTVTLPGFVLHATRTR